MNDQKTIDAVTLALTGFQPGMRVRVVSTGVEITRGVIVKEYDGAIGAWYIQPDNSASVLGYYEWAFELE